jgi:hypothetical protein
MTGRARRLGKRTQQSIEWLYGLRSAKLCGRKPLFAQKIVLRRFCAGFALDGDGHD